MSVILIMWLRELRRYTRSRAQIVASLGQPLLYLLALGFGWVRYFKKPAKEATFNLLRPA